MNINRKYLFIFLRYALAVFLGLFNLSFIYLIIAPTTSFSVYLFGNLFLSDFARISAVEFSLGSSLIKLIPACFAGAAYYLLIILNLTTPMNLKKRTYSLVFLLVSFFILNVIRIIIFIGLLAYGVSFFDIAHEFTWYFGSTFLVVILWFANVKIFKINSVPFYGDIKNLYNAASKHKRL